MTVEQAVYDVIERLGLVSDDSRVSYRLVANWLSQARNVIVPEYIAENGIDIPSSMIKRYTCISIAKTLSDCDDCQKELTITLPVAPMSLPNESGIIAVLRTNGKPIQRLGSSGMKTLLRSNRFADTGWWKIGDTVHLKGRYPDQMKVELQIVPSGIDSYDKTDELPAPDATGQAILEEAEKIGRRWLGTFSDEISEGVA